MDALDFLDDNYGVCLARPNGSRYVVSLLLIVLLAFLLIKRTELDLEQMRRRYLALD